MMRTEVWTKATLSKYVVYYSYAEDTPTMFHVFDSLEEAQSFVASQDWEKPWAITVGEYHGT